MLQPSPAGTKIVVFCRSFEVSVIPGYFSSFSPTSSSASTHSDLAIFFRVSFSFATNGLGSAVLLLRLFEGLDVPLLAELSWWLVSLMPSSSTQVRPFHTLPFGGRPRGFFLMPTPPPPPPPLWPFFATSAHLSLLASPPFAMASDSTDPSSPLSIATEYGGGSRRVPVLCATAPHSCAPPSLLASTGAGAFVCVSIGVGGGMAGPVDRPSHAPGCSVPSPCDTGGGSGPIGRCGPATLVLLVYPPSAAGAVSSMRALSIASMKIYSLSPSRSRHSITSLCHCSAMCRGVGHTNSTKNWAFAGC
mmetsp:Transcript_22384/g.57401  ORF Transcript_22384/g.57401 Transcript_22384/m.57401 type:complete len:304 (+) Transcript_22384:766-1677(+)